MLSDEPADIAAIVDFFCHGALRAPQSESAVSAGTGEEAQ
jgi:hypothetical protein